MKSNSKPNLILFSFIALITISFAVVSKGSSLAKKRITSCFSKITITNGYNSVKLEYSTCQEAIAAVGQHLYVKTASNSKDPDSCLGGQQLFYCATVAEVTDSLVPLINIGDGLKRYAIETIFCTYMPE